MLKNKFNRLIMNNRIVIMEMVNKMNVKNVI